MEVQALRATLVCTASDPRANPLPCAEPSKGLNEPIGMM
jgi:hypothetical protein